MANHMDEVARMLGVEIGEEFQIKDKRGKILDAKYMISLRGIEVVIDGDWEESGWLEALIVGDAEIIKKPWRPYIGEYYWYCVSGQEIAHNCYTGTILERYLIKSGNCYRTETEASKHYKEWEAWFESDERVDVFNGR